MSCVRTRWDFAKTHPTTEKKGKKKKKVKFAGVSGWDSDLTSLSSSSVAEAEEEVRTCGKNGCKQTLPPITLYWWKLCSACREKTRNRAREKRGVSLTGRGAVRSFSFCISRC